MYQYIYESIIEPLWILSKIQFSMLIIFVTHVIMVLEFIFDNIRGKTHSMISMNYTKKS